MAAKPHDRVSSKKKKEASAGAASTATSTAASTTESPASTTESPASPPPPLLDDGQAKREKRRGWVRAALILVGVGGVAALALSIDFEPNLRHVDIGVLSGVREGHYHAQVERFARRASRTGGRVRNISTAGSIENLRRLANPGPGCEVDFGLVQDGEAFESVANVEAVARLPHGETLFFLGRDADAIDDFRDLRGLRIGVGPEESGTAELIRTLFALPGFDSLEIEKVHGPVAEQIEDAANGELDLAAMVLYEDATLVDRAVRERHLRIASFSSAPAVAARIDGVSAGILEAGHYDAVHGFPLTDRRVLRVDTLLLGSRCASRSEINAILTVLGREVPGFVEHNRASPPPHGLRFSTVASEFYENHGPAMVDEYLPRVVDIVPLSNFMTLVMGLSILFNVMSFLNRFRLWRLDTNRAKVEGELRDLFGGGFTRKEIDQLDPSTTLTTEVERVRLDATIRHLDELLQRCRRQAASMLVPMGQEMVYRYQESLILEVLAVSRSFRRRLPTAPTEPPSV